MSSGCRPSASKTQTTARPEACDAKIPNRLTLRGVLAGILVHGSRAAGLAAISIAISRLNRAALMMVSAPAAYHQAKVIMRWYDQFENFRHWWDSLLSGYCAGIVPGAGDGYSPLPGLPLTARPLA